jgi:hypothetical protein
MKFSIVRNWLFCGAAVVGLSVANHGVAFAESGGSGGQGSAHMENGGGQGSDVVRRKGAKGAERGGSGHGSLRDVFREMEVAPDSGSSEQGSGADSGKKGQSGRKSDTAKGARPEGKGRSDVAKGKGGKPAVKEAGETEDSDKPAWAGVSGPETKPGRGGGTEPGTKKGDIYGDLYVVVRDANGVPVLDENGYVQVQYYDADGKITCCIPRDAEGNLLTTLADGTPVLPIEIELGRLSVGRSPDAVLAAQYEEATTTINNAASVSLDASGRLVVTNSDGTTQTIDSPLENLALYVELLNTGTLAGIDASKLGSLSYLVDGTLTAQDLAIASSFFAAASDKTIPITTDSIVYMNTILGIDGSLEGNYVDYSSFTYDRQDVYGDMQIEVLVEQADGSWVPTQVNVYDAVFHSTSTGSLTNVAAFTTATDDARAVIDYIHEYALPETE